MTQETKHTPAPWDLKEPTADGQDGHIWLVGQPNGKDDIGIIAKIGGNREQPEIRANAKLIAESPAMLKALKNMMPNKTGYCQSMDWKAYDKAVKEAQAVIDKAEGKA